MARMKDVQNSAECGLRLKIFIIHNSTFILALEEMG